MLYKHSSAIARDAAFVRPAAVVVMPAQDQAGPLPPSPGQREISRLEQENEELNTQLEALRTRWAVALAAAEEAAREAAARQHVRDDAELAAMLAESLHVAGAEFADHLQAEVAPAATRLAESAFARLVTVRQADRDWLARLVERRLADLQKDMAVAVRIGPLGLGRDEDADDSEAALRAILPAATAFIVDQTLSPGTARIALRLGGISIDPQQGLARVRAVLAEETANG